MEETKNITGNEEVTENVTEEVVKTYTQEEVLKLLQSETDKRVNQALATQQKKFDGVKWFDSIRAGDDQCGSYDFCVECRKDESNPCA